MVARTQHTRRVTGRRRLLGERRTSRQHDDERLGNAPEVEVQQHEDDAERDRHDELELRPHPLHGFELTAPGKSVSGGKGDAVGDDALRLPHITPNIASGDVDGDGRHRKRILRLHGHRSLYHLDVRDLAQRDLRAGHGRDHDLAQFLGVVAQLTRVPDVHVVAFPSFHRDCRI